MGASSSASITVNQTQLTTFSAVQELIQPDQHQQPRHQRNSVAAGATFLIHTLRETEQACLIATTLTAAQEIALFTAITERNDPEMASVKKIIVYGKNSTDPSAYRKQAQLAGMGFANVLVYPGGLFEWLLLQDIYGDELFPTTAKELDLLQFS